MTLISQVAGAQTPSAVSTTDRRHPFVEHAEQRYRQYLTSESQGDAAAYKAVRTRQAYDTTMGQLKQLGKPDSDLGPMLKRVAGMQSDVSRLTFVRCDARDRVARLLLTRAISRLSAAIRSRTAPSSESFQIRSSSASTLRRSSRAGGSTETFSRCTSFFTHQSGS